MRNGWKIVDADCHQMEPADVWERYIDPELRSRAPRLQPGQSTANAANFLAFGPRSSTTRIDMPHLGGEPILIMSGTVVMMSDDRRSQAVCHWAAAPVWTAANRGSTRRQATDNSRA